MPRPGCSLASLMLLVTTAAVVLAAMRSGFSPEPGAHHNPLDGCHAAVAVLVGILIGAAAGLQRSRPIVGLLCGAFAGLLLGLVVALLLASPRAFPALLVGSLLVVAYVAAVRHFTRRAP